MAYTLDFGISLGSARAGLTLNAQLVDQAGADTGSPITTGFAEIGNGCYLLDASIPDGHRGGIRFYDSGDPSTVLAFASINPESVEIVTTIDADLTAIADELAEMHGLLGKHYGMRNAVYDGVNLTSYDICVYDSAADATANDGATGLLHKYSVANTYDTNGSILTSVTTRVS